MNKNEVSDIIAQKEELDEKEKELEGQYQVVKTELDNCRKRKRNLTEITEVYMKSCVGKCFSCDGDYDDLIWIYEDSKFGLTELRARKESNLIRQTRIDLKRAEAFIKSGFVERKGENNRGIFRHLFYSTIQNIEKEAGLID